MYDSLRKIKYNKELNKEFEQELIYSVCLKIDEYIQIINPRNRVFIAFDGVAPVENMQAIANQIKYSDARCLQVGHMFLVQD